MSVALDAILNDVESVLEITVEIDSAKRSDGTLKTWYFSTHPRSTGGSETPANTEFLPFLKLGGTLGPLSQSLSEDIQFSGLAESNPGSLTLIQSVMDNDELSVLNDYVFAGYKVRMKIGRSTDLYAAFVLFRTATVSIDPTVQSASDGLHATFRLASVLKRMLEESLILKRYLGIPHCLRFLPTVTGTAVVTKQAVHDAKSFTVGIRFRLPSVPPTGTSRRIWTKAASTGIAANSHWFMRIESSGVLFFLSSSSLVADISYTGITNLCDNNWHSVIFSRDNATTAYIMVDSVETSYTPTGQVDASNFGLFFGESTGAIQMDLCDARMLDKYLTPDEARSYFSTRSSGDDLNVIGLWRFDDNAGSTANDYSATNADAVITGTINTNYAWKETDLGEPELAGQSYPLVIGNVLNARAHLIDAFRERYRGNNDSNFWYQTGVNLNLTVRSQGTVLTGGGVDYTAPATGGDGVFSTTSEEAEPVTFDLINNGTNEYTYYPSYVAYNLLSTRTRILSSEISNVDPLAVLCPWPGGYHTDKDTTAEQALSEILGQSGMHYREDYDGSVYFDMLLPPTGYGPYGDPCLDLRGGQANRIVWGDIADISGSLTICAWVKLQVLDQTAYNWGISEPNQGSMFIVTKGGLSGNYTLWFQAIGVDAGKLKIRTAGTTLASPAGVMTSDSWYFVASVFDIAADTMKLYIGKKGGSLFEVASGTNTGAQSVNSQSLMVGDSGARFPWMSVAGVHIWSTTKTKTQLEALMTTPPVGNEASLSFYAPINEGSGNPLDVVSSTYGTISNVDPLDPNGALPEWAPKLIVNLNETPSVKLNDFHHTHPAWNVITNFNKNRYPMENSDIDTGVSQNNRLALTRKGLDVRFESSTIKGRFKSAKKIVLDSPITDQESAQRLLRAILRRFGTDTYTGTLQFPSGLNISRLACGMAIGDEIGLIATIPSQLQVARSFRVVAVAPNPLQLSTTIAIVG